MSYTPSPLRPRREAPDSEGRARRPNAPRGDASQPAPGADAVAHASGEMYDEELDWGRVGLFGAGIALGALIGAGTALLLAPQSGAETRRSIALRARGMKYDAADAWDDLGEQLSLLRRAARRKVRRKQRDAGRSVTRGRWAFEDAISG